MPSLRVDTRRGADARGAEVHVVRDGRLDFAEVVERLRDERRRRLAVDWILGADVHALPLLPRRRRVDARADVPRIDRKLEVGAAGEVVGIVHAIVQALAPVGGGAYRQVGAGGEADHADPARVYRVLLRVAPEDADRALDVAERSVALVGRAVQQHRGGEPDGVEPVRDLGSLLVPSELRVAAAGENHHHRLRAVALRREEREERVVDVGDDEVALPELVLHVPDGLVVRLHRDLALGPELRVGCRIVLPELGDKRLARLGRLGVRAVALRVALLPRNLGGGLGERGCRDSGDEKSRKCAATTDMPEARFCFHTEILPHRRPVAQVANGPH